MNTRTITSRFRPRLLAVLTLSLCGSPLACAEEEAPSPVIGEWRSFDAIDGYYNELEIDDDMKGEAKIFAYADGGFYEFTFDVDVEKHDDEWRFEMDCGGCSDFSFRMVCEFDGGDMECDGDKLWQEYVFEWEID